MTIKERISHLTPVATQVSGSIKRRHSTPVAAMASLGVAVLPARRSASGCPELMLHRR